MAKIKNLHKGILHIPSAGLRLNGEAIVDVKKITSDIKRYIETGLIVLVTDEEAAKQPPQLSKVPDPPAEYEKLDEAEAIEFVEEETDPKIIRNILQTEHRSGVLDSLKDRLKEIDDAHK